MCSPGAMSVVAKPMIWSNLRIGSPKGIGRVATLWPAGMRWVACKSLELGARQQVDPRHDDIVIRD